MWQPLYRPGALLVLQQAELQAIQLQLGHPRRTRQQAGEHVRHQAHLIQAQCTGTLAQLHIMGDQQRRKALPAPFQAAYLERHSEGRAGFVLGLQAILGNQRHQLAAEADIQRRQHQQQRATRQSPAQGRREQTGKALHSVHALSAHNRITAEPHRIAPGSTSSRPET
ncbi:hypothetical protein FQZ97_846920 [compost metagenome]